MTQVKLNIPHIVQLINAGVLGIKSLYWLCDLGYVIVYANGNVENIVPA